MGVQEWQTAWPKASLLCGIESCGSQTWSWLLRMHQIDCAEAVLLQVSFNNWCG